MRRDDSLIYTRHARTQMERRRISKQNIEDALDRYHTTYPGTNPGGATVVYVGTVTSNRDRRDLAVVVDGLVGE